MLCGVTPWSFAGAGLSGVRKAFPPGVVVTGDSAEEASP